MIKLTAFLLLFFPVAALSAENVSFESGPEKISVIELFGSEGCSSCPPADVWLNGLKDDPGLWKNFVAMSFHVDYWDYLGWKDPFSSVHATQHQQEYANVWNSKTLYTPCMVLNGGEWRSWAAEKRPPLKSDETAGILKIVKTSENKWEVTFEPVLKSNRFYEAHLAFLGMGIEIEVKAGENQGRRLRHEFVVLSHERMLMNLDQNKYAAVFEPRFEYKKQTLSLALVVWISEKNHPQPLQAAGGFLPA